MNREDEIKLLKQQAAALRMKSDERVLLLKERVADLQKQTTTLKKAVITYVQQNKTTLDA
jgi:hypothetical protein